MSESIKMEWLEKKSANIDLNKNTRITIVIEKTGSPRYLNDDDTSLSPEEKATIFASNFVELLENDLTPRQVKALINELEKKLK